jgi:cytochrome b561
MNTPKRYHPLLVTLHWLTVILLFGAGMLSESGRRSPINIHMILGAALLLVMIARVIVRFTTKHPEWADTGNKFLNQLGALVHLGLYLAAFLILGVGGLIAYNRNLFAYALGTSTTVGRSAGAFSGFHELGWALVLGLTFLHVGAALYHQFILKDNLLARMWYGK